MPHTCLTHTPHTCLTCLTLASHTHYTFLTHTPLMPHTCLTHRPHISLKHTPHMPHTCLNTCLICTTHTHTHTPHAFFFHSLSTCSSQALLPSSCPSLLLILQKHVEKKTLYIHWQIKFKRIRESHKESRITIVSQCFHLPYSQASGQSNNNCKLIIVETLNFNLLYLRAQSSEVSLHFPVKL